jgi:phage terminase small subunit
MPRRTTDASKRAKANFRPGTARNTTRLPRGAPRPPDWLEPEARAEWGRTVRLLSQAGALSKAHRSALAAYCCLWAEFAAAKGALATPRLGEMRRLMCELGLTPKSVVETLPASGDEFAPDRSRPSPRDEAKVQGIFDRLRVIRSSRGAKPPEKQS